MDPPAPPQPPEENRPTTGPRREVLEEIWKTLQRIDYGEVVITIHDRKIVQIEKREKIRFGK